VSWHYIQPGKPTQNAFVERNNGSMRRDLLNVYAFESLKQARQLSKQWQWDYNHERPHKALGYLSPVVYAQKSQLNSEPKDRHSTTALSTNPRKPAPPEQAGRIVRICG
jgi:transposase InsO family protein